MNLCIKNEDRERIELLENEVDATIAEAIVTEMERASILHGEYFFSRHEKESVLREELEEVSEWLVDTTEAFDKMHRALRDNNSAAFDNDCKRIASRASLIALEAIQLAGVAKKGVKDVTYTL